MPFRPHTAPELVAETPERTFPLLPRTGSNSDGLWSQQTDILRDYMAHVDTHDLAVELPTGTGKTLPGLLIADWRRRARRGRSLFACPTVQLVKQVMKAAEREGVPVVDLSGGWRTWDTADSTRYESARATAIVTYSTVFNVNPHVGEPDVLVFDDAHAADQYVSSAYTVSISRRELPSVYEDLLEALKPGLTNERHAQLIMTTPGLGTKASIDALFPALRDDWIEPVDHALNKLSGIDSRAANDQAFRYAAIRGHLTACNVYVTWDRIEIRPLIAPTFENAVFSGARQRVYLSATLGSAGELERAFSRPSITRLRLAPEAAKPRSGRRFVLFPQLSQGADPNELAKQILALADRAIVLTPSDRAIDLAESEIVPDSWTAIRKDAVADSFEPFAAASRVACILANRYDGIDLPGEACRVVALYGLPRATTLHEEFLSTRARSSMALDERVRARVVQGTGRCTRGPRDWAVVVIADAETTSYLSRPEVIESLDEDLQAEIQFGLEQSEAPAADLLDNVRIFLLREPAWQTQAEPTIAELRSAARVTLPATSAGLLAAAPHEVRAAESSWNGDFNAAGESDHQAADALSSLPDAKGYRALQLFLAAIHINTAGRLQSEEERVRVAGTLADQAVRVAAPATWMRSSLPLPGVPDRPNSPADDFAIDRLTAEVALSTSTPAHHARIAAMNEGLSAIDHAEYEPALSTLGRLIGAEAWKPTGDGRADSVWCWGDYLWLTLEAKSEHLADGQIGLDDVRQVNEHLEFLSADRRVAIPSGSVSVMISPREVFRRDAIVIAEPFTFKLLPSELLSLAASVERTWLSLLTLRNITNDQDRRESVATVLKDARMLPSDVLDRLTQRAIREP